MPNPIRDVIIVQKSTNSQLTVITKMTRPTGRNDQVPATKKRISDIIFEIEMGTVSANEQQSHWQDIPPQGYMNMLQNQQVYR